MAIIQTVDIIRDLVTRLDFYMVVDNIVDNGNDTYTLFTENTYYCTKEKEIAILGFIYTVILVDFNKSITVTAKNHANNPLLVETIYLPAPTFFHGTVKSTDKEIIRTSESAPQLYPIVYLHEILTEKIIVDPKSNAHRHSPIKIYFLDIGNFADNLNNEFLQDVLKPLSNLETEWEKQMEKDCLIGTILSDWNRTNIPIFGRYDKNGILTPIFSEQLSGLELSMTIPILKC